MQLYNSKTGRLEQVANPDEAIKSGTHRGGETDTYRIVDPATGKVYEAIGTALPTALKSGAMFQTAAERQEDEAEKKYGDSHGRAFLEGAVRSLSFGGSDVAANLVGAAEGVAARKKLHPISSTAGEIIGLVGPLVLTGGTSAIAHAARASTALVTAARKGAQVTAEKLIAKRIVEGAAKEAGARVASRNVVGAAIEGAAYGAGQTVSEAALGEPTHIAENLLIGGGFGAGIPILGILGKKLASSKISKEAAARVISGGDEGRTAVVKQFLENSDDGFLRRQLALKGASAVDELASKVTSLFENAKEVAAIAKKDVAGIRKAKISEILDAAPKENLMRATPAVNELESRLLETMQLFRDRPAHYSNQAITSLGGVVDDVGKQLKKATTPGQKFEAIDELKAKLYGLTQENIPSASKTEIGNLHRSVLNLLEDPQIWGEAASVQQKLNQAYSTFQTSEAAFKQLFTRKVGNARVINARTIKNFAKKANEPEYAAHRDVLERFIEDGNRLQQVVYNVSGKIKQTADIIADMPSIRSNMEKLAELSSFQQLKSSDSFVLKQMLKASTVGGIVGGMPGAVLSGLAVPALTPKRVITTLAWLEKNANKVNDRWAEALANASSSVYKIAPVSIAGSVKSRSEKEIMEEVKTVQELVSNPEALVELTTQAINPLKGSAPGIAGALSERAMGIVSYLGEHAPKNPHNDLYAHSENWKPSDAQLRSYARKSEAAQNPMVLLEEIKNGQINRETVDTVKALYPNLYQRTVEGMSILLAHNKKTIPYAKRLQLSYLFGLDADGSVRPSTVMSYQVNFNKQIAQQPQRGPGRPRAPKAPNLSEFLTTAGQKLQE